MAFVRVAQLEELANGKPQAFRVGGREIAICRVRDQVFAIANTCTHAAGTLSQGRLSGHTIQCPTHLGKFDIRDGQPMAFPASTALPVYPTEIVDGVVRVDVSPIGVRS